MQTQLRGSSPAPSFLPVLTGAGGRRWVQVCPVVAIAAGAERRRLGAGAAVGGTRGAQPRTLAGLEGPGWAGCKEKSREVVLGWDGQELGLCWVLVVDVPAPHHPLEPLTGGGFVNHHCSVLEGEDGETQMGSLVQAHPEDIRQKKGAPKFPWLYQRDQATTQPGRLPRHLQGGGPTAACSQLCPAVPPPPRRRAAKNHTKCLINTAMMEIMRSAS